MKKRVMLLMLSLMVVCATVALPAMAEADLTLYLLDGETQTEISQPLQLTMGSNRVTLTYGGESADSNVTVTFGTSGIVTSTWNRNLPYVYLTPAGEGSTTVTVTLSDGRSATINVEVAFAAPDEVEVRYDHPDYTGQYLSVEDEFSVAFSDEAYPLYPRALANGNPDIVNASAITFSWTVEDNTCGASIDDANRLTVTAAGSAKVKVEALLNGEPTGVIKEFTLNSVWQKADANTLCIRVGDQVISGLRYEYGSDKINLTYLDENDQTKMTEVPLEGLTLVYDASNIAFVDPDDMLWESNNPSVATVEDGKVVLHIELTPGDSAQAVLTVIDRSHTVAANIQLYIFSRANESSEGSGNSGDTGSGGCGGSSAAAAVLSVLTAAAVLLKKGILR